MPVQQTSVVTLSFTFDDEILEIPPTVTVGSENATAVLTTAGHNNVTLINYGGVLNAANFAGAGVDFDGTGTIINGEGGSIAGGAAGISATAAGISILNFGTVTGTLTGISNAAVALAAGSVNLDNRDLVYGR